MDGGGGGGGGGIISGGCGGACNNLLQTAYKPTNGQDRCGSTLRVYLCVCVCVFGGGVQLVLRLLQGYTPWKGLFYDPASDRTEFSSFCFSGVAIEVKAITRLYRAMELFPLSRQRNKGRPQIHS